MAGEEENRELLDLILSRPPSNFDGKNVANQRDIAEREERSRLVDDLHQELARSRTLEAQQRDLARELDTAKAEQARGARLVWRLARRCRDVIATRPSHDVKVLAFHAWLRHTHSSSRISASLATVFDPADSSFDLNDAVRIMGRAQSARSREHSPAVSTRSRDHSQGVLTERTRRALLPEPPNAAPRVSSPLKPFLSPPPVTPPRRSDPEPVQPAPRAFPGALPSPPPRYGAMDTLALLREVYTAAPPPPAHRTPRSPSAPPSLESRAFGASPGHRASPERRNWLFGGATPGGRSGGSGSGGLPPRSPTKAASPRASPGGGFVRSSSLGTSRSGERAGAGPGLSDTLC